MKRLIFQSDFAILPREVGGESTLRDFLLLARQCHTRTLVCEVADGIRPELPPLEEDFPQVLLASTDCTDGADYHIAEVKTVAIEGRSYPMPESDGEWHTLLQLLGGEGELFFKAVFEKLAALASEHRYDVVRFPKPALMGIEAQALNPHLRQMMLDATDAWLDRNAVFEVRTSKRTALAYPSVLLLRRIGQRRGRVTLSSGAQTAKGLFCGFDFAYAQLRASGVGALSVPTGAGFESLPIR